MQQGLQCFLGYSSSRVHTFGINDPLLASKNSASLSLQFFLQGLNRHNLLQFYLLSGTVGSPSIDGIIGRVTRLFFHFLSKLQPTYSIIGAIQIVYLTEYMERMAVKSLVTLPHEEHSFRSNRTTSHYNINDYLPPNSSAFSRTSVFVSRQKEKVYTEPNDRINSMEVLEFKRRLERQEEERDNLRREIERLNSRLQAQQREIKQKDNIIVVLNKKLDDSEVGLKTLMEKNEQRPLLSHSRSNLHYIYFPKFSQRYEVSVQTDAVQYHTSPTTFLKPSLPVKNDRQLSEIEEKMSKLNQFKKLSKERTMKIQEYPVKYQRIDPIFSKIDDKENVMRLSNTFERLSNIPEQRFREQTIQILPVDIDQVERLIRIYMD